MKQALIVLALIGLAFSNPQPRKLFHEHFEDFMEIIVEEAGLEMMNLLEEYMQYEEFVASMDYMLTNNFKDIILEMESLPEFKAVIDFLENDNIDINYFIDMINEIFDEVSKRSVHLRGSGRDLSSFINDSIKLFPTAKLSALFDEKMANDKEFSTAINNLQGEEWDQVFTALWESEMFQKEIKTLNDNGIDIGLLLDQVMAIFGQN